jgi:carnitine 3-dehydrogenase
MGPHLACALAGGSGGMEHFMAHLAPDVTGRWSRLGTPVMTDALKRRLIDGVETEIAGRTIDDLARSRDDFLVRLLEARRAAKN